MSIKTTFYLRRPISGNTIKNGEIARYCISEVSCSLRGPDDPEETPQMLESAHKSYVNDEGQPVALEELRRWKLKAGLVEAWRINVYFLPTEEAHS